MKWKVEFREGNLSANGAFSRKAEKIIETASDATELDVKSFFNSDMNNQVHGHRFICATPLKSA
jgi:hypothetical protein